MKKLWVATRTIGDYPSDVSTMVVNAYHSADAARHDIMANVLSSTRKNARSTVHHWRAEGNGFCFDYDWDVRPFSISDDEQA
mgnify:CR=1 FL=1